MTENDLVNHPNHYGGKDNPYETIKVIENWKLNFNLGNAIKYLARADHKENKLQDTIQGDINKKNPFVGKYQSANSYFGAKQQEKKWRDLSKQAEKNGGTTTYTDDKGNKQTITKKDADSKSNDAREQASKASLSFAEALQNSVGKLQTWNNGLSMLGSTIEALGGGSDVSDAAGVAGGMLNGAQSMSGLGPWGMAAGAAEGIS